MVTVSQLTLSFGSFDLLRDITFVINPGDRIGLVGKNGAGKSTILKLLCRMMEPTRGNISLAGSATIGYLPQEMRHHHGKTVIEEAVAAFEELLSLEKKIEKLNHEIHHRADHHSDEYMEILHQFSDATERYNLLGGNMYLALAEQTLAGLGFENSDMNRPVNTFSGGWRMRIELAKILLRKPDLLLLDEPTNHLDIESIQWLEDFLGGYKGAVVLVSHDRAFLDNVTNRTIEISLGRIFDYSVPYSRFVILSRERREQQMAAFRNQQKLIDDTKEFIDRFRYKATKAVQVQSRIKQLEKLDILEVEEEDNSTLKLRFQPSVRPGTIVVEATGLTKRYGENLVLNKINLIVERGEKVAFVGKNGAGKTTLSKVIIGETDHQGMLKIGHNVKTGYFAQNTDELLDHEKTVFEVIDAVAVGEIRHKIRDILGAFLFRGEDVDKKVKVLSGGEKSRLAMARLLLEPYNLLVLDEPTNHLDMRSKDILKEALLQYEGTLIIVSHDRYFLDGLVGKIYEFRDRNIRQHIGGIYDFLKKRKLSSLAELEKRGPVFEKNPSEQGITRKKTYLEKKDRDKKVRKLEAEIREIENRISFIENRLEEVSRILAAPGNLDELPSLSAEYSGLEKNLQSEMERWEKSHAGYESFLAGNDE
jgi:ATP-binding cassette, subfamily F, member 3